MSGAHGEGMDDHTAYRKGSWPGRPRDTGDTKLRLHPSLLSHPLARDAPEEAHLRVICPPTQKKITLNGTPWTSGPLPPSGTGEEREDDHPPPQNQGEGEAGRSPFHIWHQVQDRLTLRYSDANYFTK